MGGRQATAVRTRSSIRSAARAASPARGRLFRTCRTESCCRQQEKSFVVHTCSQRTKEAHNRRKAKCSYSMARRITFGAASGAASGGGRAARVATVAQRGAGRASAAAAWAVRWAARERCAALRLLARSGGVNGCQRRASGAPPRSSRALGTRQAVGAATGTRARDASETCAARHWCATRLSRWLNARHSPVRCLVSVQQAGDEARKAPSARLRALASATLLSGCSRRARRAQQRLGMLASARVCAHGCGAAARQQRGVAVSAAVLRAPLQPAACEGGELGALRARRCTARAATRSVDGAGRRR